MNHEKHETHENAGEVKRGLVGLRYNDEAMVAWNFIGRKNIIVTATKVKEHLWQIIGCAAGTTRITATVLGGKNATLRYIKFIRNGIMSRVGRRKHHAATQPSSAKATEGRPLTTNN